MDSSPSSSSQSSFSSMAAKVFVGGITNEVEENVLKEYFGKYGDVKEVVVLRDRATGNVKGYGFVEFVDSEAADKAINEKEQHLVLNIRVDVKRARSRSEERSNYQISYQQSSDHSTENSINKEQNITSTKIFVGGLSSDITGDEFKSYFEKFGPVNDFVIMYDRETRRPRGFGFITFDFVEAAQTAVQMRFHELNKKRVEVKMAVPRAGHDSTCSIYNKKISNSSPSWKRVNSSIIYQPWVYPSYDPKYAYYYSQASSLFPGYGFGLVDYEGGYAYSPAGYGASYDYPSLTLNELTVRQIPYPCCDTSFNPGYAITGINPGYASVGTGAYMRIVNGGYHGAVWLGKGKLNQTSNVQRTKPNIQSKISLDAESVKVDKHQ